MSQFSEQEQQILKDTARQSILHGMTHRARMTTDVEQYPPKLQELGASFVTLHINKKLRGCIGSLIAYYPLVRDVVDNAHSAAFLDPRFPPLTPEEFVKTAVSISVLSTPEPLAFSSEADLISKIRPNVDGLVFIDQTQYGTFLPSVWEQFTTPEEFLRNLKMKAGFQPDHWSDTININRYTTELIE